MILVSGAGGKTGRAIIEALTLQGQQVRAFVRREQPISGAELFIGDMLKVDDWARAIAGCGKLYHICPNMHPDEVEIGRIAILAASTAGISHFVYHSVLHPHIQDMPHHWNKLFVEEALFSSGLPYTVLQPTAYMQNIRIDAVRQTGRLTNPYAVASAVALVDLRGRCRSGSPRPV